MDENSEKTPVDRFAEYYKDASLTEEAIERFQSIQDVVQGVLDEQGENAHGVPMVVADVGCGAGTQALIWARNGHTVKGIDINTELIDIARQRSAAENYPIEYFEGSAEDLPWDDSTFDVCLVPELLEHVEAWERCLDEFARILKVGGVLYLSTNNVLCPVQQEFALPLYSWYPKFLKRYYERLSVTSKPELVNYAKFPAINWFSFYSLNKEFLKRGLTAIDRFDATTLENKGIFAKLVIKLIRTVPPIRFIAHVFTPYTALVATKHKPTHD